MQWSRDEEIQYIQKLIDRPKPKCNVFLQKVLANEAHIEFIGRDMVTPELEFRPYQIVGALHLASMPRFVLGDDTGVGKTIQEILAMSMVRAKKPDMKFIVVCPKSAVLQWVQEVQRFSKVLNFRPLLSDKYRTDARKEILKDFTTTTEYNGIVTNYSILTLEKEALIDVAESTPIYLILDEVTSVKNWLQRNRPAVCKAADHLSKAVKYIHGLSATVMKKSPMEVWAIFNLLLPGVFPGATMFKNLFALERLQKITAKKKVRVIYGYKNVDYMREVIAPYYLGRKKTEPNISQYVPKIVARDVVVELHPDVQKKKYEEALSGILDLENGDIAETTNPLACMLYCSQIACSPEVIGIKGKSSKVIELFRLLEDEVADEKTVIFSKSKKFINILQEKMKKQLVWGELQPTLRITGDENDKVREQNKTLFRTDPRYKIMFLTMAGSEAINLQAAPNMIFMDPPITYGDLIQLIGRINRSGSVHTHNFLYFMLAQNTIDENIMTLIRKEKGWFDAILGESAPGAIEFEDASFIKSLYEKMRLDAKNVHTM